MLPGEKGLLQSRPGCDMDLLEALQAMKKELNEDIQSNWHNVRV